MKTGEHWYAMQDADGRPQGFAQLVLARRPAGGLEVTWEMRIAFTGGTYEERRTMTLDSENRLERARYVGEGNDVRLQLEGDRLVGTAVDPRGEEKPVDVEVSPDVLTGMGFVLLADLPREAGYEVARGDFNESAVRDEGRVTLRAVGADTIAMPEGEVEAWKTVLVRSDGRELPVWVGEEGVILLTDWGGMWMQRRDGPTTELFQPEAPALVEIEGGPAGELVLEGSFPNLSPAAMFRAWTDAAWLPRWWPDEAEVEAEVGGAYHLAWKEPAWFLRGEVRVFEPPGRFGFSWAWDHLQDLSVREVVVSIGADEGGGSRLRITHGPYGGDPAEVGEREGHLRGWLFFGARLALLDESAPPSAPPPPGP